MNAKLLVPVIFVAVLNFVFAPEPDAQSNTVSKQDVIDLILQYRSTLPAYSYRSTHTMVHLTAPNPDDIRQGEIETRFATNKSGQILFEMKWSKGEGHVQSHRRLAFDGTMWKKLDLVKKIGVIESNQNNVLRSRGILNQAMMWIPGYRSDSDMKGIHNDLLRHIEKANDLAIESKSLFGHKGLMVRFVGSDKAFWVDVEAGGMVRRIDFFGRNEHKPGNLIARKEISEIFEFEDRSFPSKFQEISYDPGTVDPDSAEGYPIVTGYISGTVDKESLDFRLKETYLNFEFPAGTVFTDDRVDHRFFVTDTGEIRLPTGAERRF
jgi:hypothetical protein